MTNCLQKHLAHWLCVLFIIAPSVHADILKDQVVTFADFNYVNSISSSMQHVYFATTEGITRFNKFEDRWEMPLTGGEGLGSEQVLHVIVEEFDTRLYAETATGIYEFDSLFDRWYSLSELPVVNTAGTHSQIPTVMHTPADFQFPGDGTLQDPDGRYFGITDVLDDDDGNMWFGTWGYGTARAGSNSLLMEMMPFGLIQNSVIDILPHDGKIWVSGLAPIGGRSGISIYDPENNTFEYIEPEFFNKFPAIDIFCLAVNEQTIFMGSEEGLLMFDRSMERVTRTLSTFNGLPHDNILSLQLMGDSLFVGTQEGLAMITSDGDSTTFLFPGRFNGMAVYCFELVDSLLWIGTSEGAFRLQLSNGKLHQFIDPDGVLTGNVYDIASWGKQLVFAAPDGVVWADGNTGDVQLLMTTDRINSSVTALAINDWIVAAASDDGLTLVYYTDKKQTKRTFTTRDGFPSNNMYDLSLDGDYLWVGSDEGLSHFWWNNPSRID
jgi:ligand-binding sensor domain-containing protein